MKYIGILLVLILFVFGCKKYEEGPYLSFQQKQKRIIGDWIIQETIPIDSMDTAFQYESYVFRFMKDSAALIDYSNVGTPDTVSARWYLADNKNTFNWILSRNPNNFLFDSLSTFDIYRLTAKDFWVFDSAFTTIKFAPN